MGNQDQKGAVRWIKRGMGILTLRDGRDIVQGEFSAHRDDIPSAFRDVVRLVEGRESLESTPPELPPPVTISYTVKSAGIPGKFNVVDGQGKAINDKGLTASEANALVESLS